MHDCLIAQLLSRINKMKKTVLVLFMILSVNKCFCWGFFGHKKISYLSVFLLPPQMVAFYKEHIDFIVEHAVDPDMRRYAIAEEGPRHYIDIDHYGAYPYKNLPRNYDSAVAKFSADTIHAYGIVPWWVQTMLWRLTAAFKEKHQAKILKLSAETGHYISDAHVPLHASHNHNGQYTGQTGIHGFWESRIPELLADKEFDFWIGKAEFIKNPGNFIWARVLESGAAADSVLKFEKELTNSFPADAKFSYENRNGVTVRVYSTAFTKAYNERLLGMVERRMRQSIYATASFWYTAWVNAGQPDLTKLTNKAFTAEELKEFEDMNQMWRNGKILGREHE
jgi:cell wall assembly regulator SMI1